MKTYKIADDIYTNILSKNKYFYDDFLKLTFGYVIRDTTKSFSTAHNDFEKQFVFLYIINKNKS